MRGLLLALGLGLLACGAATAQPAGTATRASSDLQAQAADLRQLHDKLRLSADQETAWGRYAAAIADRPEAEARRQAAAELLPTLPTPRRIALMQASLAAEAGELRRTGEAVIWFYEQLSPSQQRTFDRETLPAEPPTEARQ